MADQAVSSVTNFVAASLVASAVSARQFGTWAAVVTLYWVALLVARALAGEILLMKPTNSGGDLPAALGLVVCIGLVGAIVALGLAALDLGGTGRALAALAVVLPFLLIQDLARFYSFSTGQGQWALLSDAAWLVLMVLAAVGLTQWDVQRTVEIGILLWGGPTIVISAVILGRCRPVISGGRPFIRVNWSIARGLLVENAFTLAGRHFQIVVVGAVIGLAAAGSIRAVELLLGPIIVVMLAVPLFTTPLLVSRMEEGRPVAQVRTMVGVSAAAVMATVVVAIALHSETGENIAVFLIGDSWELGEVVLVPLAGYFIFLSGSLGPLVWLRANRSTTRSALARAIQSIAVAAMSLAAAIWVHTVEGVAMAMMIGAAMGAIAWWVVALQVGSER